MVLPSRPGRAAKTSIGQVAKVDNDNSPVAKAPQLPPSPYQPIAQHDVHSHNTLLDGPPPKRQKLSIRHKQTTLDAFAVPQSSLPKPPTKVTVSQPHGQLLETVNGVRKPIGIDADELSTSPAPSALWDRLSLPDPQPAKPAEKKEDKRTLRSQDDGPRLKSELATYFNNYEEIVFDVQKEPEVITVDTVIYVVDDVPKKSKAEPGAPTSSPTRSKPSSSHVRNSAANGAATLTTLQRAHSNAYNSSPKDSLDMIARTLPDRPDDPLTDAHFFMSHRRAERKEKQLRNIERERAMHEKVQLERILDGLRGHDWLKVLGITGITDGEARKYESKRDYFVVEVQTLVDKFRLWKEEEKRQKLVKEEAAAAAVRGAESEAEDSEDGSVEPPSSEQNASAARQLQRETVNAVKAVPKLKLNFSKSKPAGSSSAAVTPRQPVAVPPLSPELPITSFYDKRHLREAALGKARHGRNVTAFGHAIPEMVEREFHLPSEYRTEDALRANARERRRRHRASVADAAAG